MTLSEALQLESGGKISNEKAAALLEFEGLVPTTLWEPAKQEMKCSLYKILLSELSRDEYSGIKRISESGGVTLELDKAEKASMLNSLALKSGCSSLISEYSSVSLVENKSYLW